MQEEYLHYLFDTNSIGKSFTTVDGNSITVLNKGIHNHNAGPDFLEASVKYDKRKWYGHIEFHVKSSDWNKHNHQFDKNYNNVVAHFVYEHDLDIYVGQFKIPTIEIKNLVDHVHHENYLKFKNSNSWIPCEANIMANRITEIGKFKTELIQQRFERKANSIINEIRERNGDRQHVFLLLIGRVFGSKVNQQAFDDLIHKIELNHLARLDYDMFKVEAYIFGLAGFLIEPFNGETYRLNLHQEFEYQKELFNLEELNVQIWKFSRMRPANFPTVRLAQFAAFLSEPNNLDNLKTNGNFEMLNVRVSQYWQSHYHFGKASSPKRAELSNDFKNLLLINAYIPYHFAIGSLEESVQVKENSIAVLHQLKKEKNNIIKRWELLEFSMSSAYDSQALLELKNSYCNHKKCLFCSIGNQLLNQANKNSDLK